ncbi:MAG: hypothetical protein R3C03_20405 [Pirellulaceae bacterium]
MLIAMVLSLFGVIHSPLPGDKMFLPYQLQSPNEQRIVWEMVASYAVMAAILFVIGATTRSHNQPVNTDEEFEKL